MEPAIRGIYVADVSGDAELGKYRSMKHCVCVSVGEGRYLLINTLHRELYNDFMIKASDYGFLKGVDRFISCHKPSDFIPAQLIKKVGMLSDADTRTMMKKIQASRFMRQNIKAKILGELLKSFKMPT